jgi:hypothetical protein
MCGKMNQLMALIYNGFGPGYGKVSRSGCRRFSKRTHIEPALNCYPWHIDKESRESMDPLEVKKPAR